MWTFKKDIFKTDNTTTNIACGGSVSFSGTQGIYEVTLTAGTNLGITGVLVNSESIPDRFQLYQNDVLVADSKYIGDGLDAGPPTEYPGLSLIGEFDLPVYQYDGGMFLPTGEIRTITNTQSDIADNITEPTDGNRFLYFNKTEMDSELKLVITGISESTSWQLMNFTCPIPLDEIEEGSDIFVYGFLSEAEKTNNTSTIGKAISRNLYIRSDNRFFFDIRCINGLLPLFGWTSFYKFINDGTTWYELDTDGNIVNSGLI